MLRGKGNQLKSVLGALLGSPVKLISDLISARRQLEVGVLWMSHGEPLVSDDNWTGELVSLGALEHLDITGNHVARTHGITGSELSVLEDLIGCEILGLADTLDVNVALANCLSDLDGINNANLVSCLLGGEIVDRGVSLGSGESSLGHCVLLLLVVCLTV